MLSPFTAASIFMISVLTSSNTITNQGVHHLGLLVLPLSNLCLPVILCLEGRLYEIFLFHYAIFAGVIVAQVLFRGHIIEVFYTPVQSKLLLNFNSSESCPQRGSCGCLDANSLGPAFSHYATYYNYNTHGLCLMFIHFFSWTQGKQLV